MTTGGQKYRLRFFFDYGAGGCLWADNDLAKQDFGIGPIDKIIADKTGKLSPETLKLIEELDDRHADYYNKDYPLDPSLWRQSECDDFNQQVDTLVNSLKGQLSPDFEIIDKQIRYSEDKDLEEYLKDTKSFRRPN
jgi:hypothetical protein